MKKNYSQNSPLDKLMIRRLTLGIVACMSVVNLSFGQSKATIASGKKVVSTLTEGGITTKTLQNGTIIKTIADGYHLDTAFYKNSNLRKDFQKPSHWKLTDRLGIAFPYCKEGKDESLFAKPGFFNTLSVDKYWGMFGLGILGGYQQFSIDNAYKTTLRNKIGYNGQTLKTIETKNYQDFYLLVGPSVSIPVAEKLFIDLGLKGGAFYSSAPVLGFENDEKPAAVRYEVRPSENSWNLGANLNLDILYEIAKNWQVGLTAAGYLTQTNYKELYAANSSNDNKLTINSFKREHGGFNLGLAVAHKFKTCTGNTIYTLLPPPPAPVICYTPSLADGLNGKIFDFGSTERPNFKWKSSSLTPEQEDYIVKVYKADGSGTPIYQQTSKNNTLSLPTDLTLGGSDGGFYYYTVQSSIEKKCLSEAAAASFIYKPKPIEVDLAATKPVSDQYKIKIFGGSTSTTYDKSGTPGTSVRRKTVRKSYKPKSTTATASTVKKRIIPRRKSTGSTTIKTTTNTSTVNYENVTENPNIKWPSDLPLPKSPSIYEYEVQRLNSGDCKPTGTVAKYRFYIDPKNPSDIRIVPDKKK